MQAQIEEMAVEEVNQPRLSSFQLKILSYGLALCCIEAFKDPEMQRKFAEWKKGKGIGDNQPRQSY